MITQFFNDDLRTVMDKTLYCSLIFYGDASFIFTEKMDSSDDDVPRDVSARKIVLQYHNVFFSFPSQIHLAIVDC